MSIKLPAGWRLIEEKLDGIAAAKDNLGVIASESTEQDGLRWLHVSFSRAHKYPSWNDFKTIREAWIPRDKTAIQVFPPMDKYVNIMSYCFHLWVCLDKELLPDFTHGNGTI